MDIVRVEWRSGIVQELNGPTADQTITMVEHQHYEGPAPAFAEVTPSPGSLGLAITEPAAGAVYLLQASADLRTWTKVMVRTSTGGTYAWEDEEAQNLGNRFYRLIVP